MNSAALRLVLGRIARGLPAATALVAMPLTMTGCIGCGPACVEQPKVVEVALSDVENVREVDCKAVCEAEVGAHNSCQVVDTSKVECVRIERVCQVGGRKPAAVAEGRVPAELDAVGRWLCEAALMEAVSVVAFDDLARDLASLDAPPELVARAREAKRQEARHTELVTQLLARRAGGVAEVSVAVNAHRPTTAFELALHNATEGCVREAWAAIEASLAATALAGERAAGAHETGAYETGEPLAGGVEDGVRAAFAEIARDEAEHALLSLDIDAWLWPKLSASQQAEVTAARKQAVRDLSRQTETGPAELGFPSAEIRAHWLSKTMLN